MAFSQSNWNGKSNYVGMLLCIHRNVGVFTCMLQAVVRILCFMLRRRKAKQQPDAAFYNLWFLNIATASVKMRSLQIRFQHYCVSAS